MSTGWLCSSYGRYGTSWQGDNQQIANLARERGLADSGPLEDLCSALSVEWLPSILSRSATSSSSKVACIASGYLPRQFDEGARQTDDSSRIQLEHTTAYYEPGALHWLQTTFIAELYVFPSTIIIILSSFWALADPQFTSRVSSAPDPLIVH